MRVLHIIRKDAQLKASFIKNQIVHHINYEAFVVFRQNRMQETKGGYALFNLRNINYLDLSEGETLWEKILFIWSKKISSRQVKRVLQYLDDQKISILHFHYGSDAGYYIPLIKRTSLPSVVSFYGYDCSGFPNLYWGFGKYYLNRRVFSRVTKVFAMSEDMKLDLISLGCPENKVIVHYYGTEIGLFKNIKRPTITAEIIKFLIISGLVPQKGHVFLLKAIKKLIENGISNFRLRIVGSGPLESMLKEYVYQNNLASCVVFPGAVRYASDAMLAELQNADIFVHPSITDVNGDKEGIPGAIVEAMAAGLPVVSTYHAGIPYILHNEITGLLVKEWDIDALAGAMERLINDSELRHNLGKNARSYATKNLDIVDKQTELEDCYNKLIRQ